MTVTIGRRELLAALGGAAAAWPLPARAQTKQTRRIGVLMGLVANDPEAKSRVVAFENGLRELGWVKERNLSIEYRWAGDGNVLRDHAAQLLAMAPDLILANSTPVTVALREQNLAVPIVFTQVVDPVGRAKARTVALYHLEKISRKSPKTFKTGFKPDISSAVRAAFYAHGRVGAYYVQERHFRPTVILRNRAAGPHQAQSRHPGLRSRHRARVCGMAPQSRFADHPAGASPSP